uniref:Uncharacterized protein n=1 Tax=Anguilla anguilla TaxID=7936 RepID=A0A0E9TJF1_ANGAN
MLMDSHSHFTLRSAAASGASPGVRSEVLPCVRPP